MCRSPLAVVEAFSAAPEAMQKGSAVVPGIGCSPPPQPVRGAWESASRPADHSDRVRKKLDVAGNPPGWSVDRVVALKFVGLVGGGVAACSSVSCSASVRADLGRDRAGGRRRLFPGPNVSCLPEGV